MKLQVRKIHEKDWSFLPSWWEAYGDPQPQRAFLPEDGLGGFIVCQGNDPIAAMFLWLTNSKTAIPAVVISDKSYQDTNRSDALQLLVDFTTDFAFGMGYEFAFAWAKPGVLLEKYENNGYLWDPKPSHEVIKQKAWEQQQ